MQSDCRVSDKNVYGSVRSLPRVSTSCGAVVHIDDSVVALSQPPEESGRMNDSSLPGLR